MKTERDIKYCLSEGIPREEIIKDSDEAILAEISGVLRRYNKITPLITSEEAIEEIKRILKEDQDNE